MFKLWAEEKSWKGYFDATVRFILACLVVFYTLDFLFLGWVRYE